MGTGTCSRNAELLHLGISRVGAADHACFHPHHPSRPLFAVPSKYQPHLFTSIILLMAGVLAGVSLEKLFGDIPYIWWAVYTWPVIAVAVGVLRPFPFLERYLPSLKMTAASDDGKKEGRGKLRKYRPHIISILAIGMGGTIVIGILYLFGLYGPDIYGSREWLEDFEPIESALIVWVVTAFCVMFDGPYGAYAKTAERIKRREEPMPASLGSHSRGYRPHKPARFLSWAALAFLIKSVTVSVLQPFPAPFKQVAEVVGSSPEADRKSDSPPIL